MGALHQLGQAFRRQPSAPAAIAAPPKAAPSSYTRRDSTPLPKPRRNYIPQQSWLDYNWIDKDPDLDMVFFAVAESGMTLEMIERETEAAGHKVSRYTLYRWFYQGTRQPHNATVATVMAVLGYERPWVRRA